MATATKTKLQNFIDGEFVDAADGATEDVLNPATGEAIAEAPLSTEADVDAAVAAAQRGVRRLVATPRRASARSRCCASPTRSRSTATSSPTSSRPTPASRARRCVDDEIPFMVDNLRFFAGAARCLEGRAAGEYMRGLHLDDPPRAGRRRRPDHALELPADDGDLEDRPGARRRQHGRAEAGRDDAADHAQARRDRAPSILPPGVLNVISGHGEPAGAGAGHAIPTSTMVSLTGSPPTGKWIAKAAADTLKRVHLELGGKAPVVVFDDVDMETAMETIAGTGYYNAGQDCTAATRVLAAPSVYDDVVTGLAEQAAGLGGGRHARGRHRRWARSTPQRQRERVEGFLERAPGPRRGRHRRRRARRCPASSSSRPSSPGSSRATR